MWPSHCMSRRDEFAWQRLDRPWPSWFGGRSIRLNRSERQRRKLKPCRVGSGRNFAVRFVELDEL